MLVILDVLLQIRNNVLIILDVSLQIVHSVTDRFFARMFHQTNIARLHFKCRNAKYPSSSVDRFPVPEDRIQWITHYPEYAPVNYTSDVVKKQPVWADPDFE